MCPNWGFRHDNAVFGTNQVELAHFDLKSEADGANLVEYAARLDKAGVNVSFWWPLSIFTNNQTATEQTWSAMSVKCLWILTEFALLQRGLGRA